MNGLDGKCLGLTCIFRLSQLRTVFCMMEQLIIPFFSLHFYVLYLKFALKLQAYKTYFLKTNSNAKPLVHY